MGSFEKFLFETSFDTAREREAKARAAAEAEEAAAAAAEPPPPSFSEEELEAARQAAFAEGKAAGLAEAEELQARRLADAVAVLPGYFEHLAEDLAQQEAARRHSALEAAVTVVRKLFPRLAREGGLEEIQAVVEACLERLRDEPRLVIRCADGDLDALRERIENSTSRGGFAGKLVFLADETIVPGDVRVEWADGGAERDQAGLWKEIDAVIARALAPAPPRPATETRAAQKQNHETPASVHADTPSQSRSAAGTESLRRAQRA